MKEEEMIMGMPVTVHVVDEWIKSQDIERIMNYFREVDEQFSTYKSTSEITKINTGKISPIHFSAEMKKVLVLCEHTSQQTNGYFDMNRGNYIDPSGLVKGYAIWNASKMLIRRGYQNFYIEIAGDIQTMGKNDEGLPWRVGIENPFDRSQIIKIVELSSGQGIATSGTYIRGNHIYNPHTGLKAQGIASLTVIAKNVYEADRFATAAFAMGRAGIDFIEQKKDLSGLIVTLNKTIIKTTNFEKFQST